MNDIIHKIASIVAGATPLLAQALNYTSPISSLTLSFIANLFGADPKNPADILAKMQADKEATQKLKELELQLNATNYQTEVDDRKSARELQSESDKITGKRDWMLPFLAITAILTFNISIVIIFFAKLDPSDHDVLYMMIGQLTSVYVMIYSFYYGSSHRENSSLLAVHDDKINDIKKTIDAIKKNFN